MKLAGRGLGWYRYGHDLSQGVDRIYQSEDLPYVGRYYIIQTQSAYLQVAMLIYSVHNSVTI